MMTKIYELKEVLIFYILLALILMLVSMHNQNIDQNMPHTTNNILNIN